MFRDYWDRAFGLSKGFNMSGLRCKKGNKSER